MFRIALTVRDRHLPDVLTYLDGKAYDLEVRPIRAPAQVGHKRSHHERIDPIADMAPIFTKQELMAHPSISPESAYHYIKRAIKEKNLKRVGRGRYQKL